ncbi:MAG TPA: nucleotidyltransferase domain-containing protein [Anaerolineales bacterium]|nr:nucleotidyltransferase domain-containing protein [Anaerolineales bacterium]
MDVQSLIENIADEVMGVEGIRAIVLGGSRARGTHTSSSDIDLGIYYDPHVPLDLRALSKLATKLDDEHRTDVITDIGGWGPWINGGGWLKVQSHAVDFLYRDLGKVTAVIEDCLRGNVEMFYQPGHPHGFVSSIYLAEVAVCQPLWDPEGDIVELKQKTTPYPESLQKGLVQKFAWEIDFSLAVAQKSVERADVAYAAGCCFRGVMCMLQVLFALNKQYWLNEKGAVALADTFVIKPTRLRARIEEAFQFLDANPQSIQKSIHILEELSKDIHVFAPGV